MSQLSQETKNLLHKFHKLQLEKKKRWALSESYYTGKPVWGESYGYDLAEPFSETEVSECEKKNDFRFPEDFRYYISNCSKELFTSSYPVKISIKDIDIKEKSCTIKGLSQHDYIVEDDYYNEDIDDHNEMYKMYESFLDCLLYVAEGGCAFSDSMILKGNRAGSIWTYCDPNYMLVAETFTQLAEKKLKGGW